MKAFKIPNGFIEKINEICNGRNVFVEWSLCSLTFRPLSCHGFIRIVLCAKLNDVNISNFKSLNFICGNVRANDISIFSDITESISKRHGPCFAIDLNFKSESQFSSDLFDNIEQSIRKGLDLQENKESNIGYEETLVETFAESTYGRLTEES